ncbi:NAD-dependent succinate-semialdehyde dehydrogenase (plasmid) [Paraburkholderia sp. PREW-6R]|uniref:NAD-dependent succinate-semialdehyde dehydrogenase n=1 Tax=Paraburkholderia sp. PREW-6R TaxID=3141544 RepID=UPI0031F59F1E
MDMVAWGPSDVSDGYVASADVEYHTQLFINGSWVESHGSGYSELHNPITGHVRARVAHADNSDVLTAIEASRTGFAVWRKRSAFNRCKILRIAADLLRERAPRVAALVTREQGKPLREAGAEIELSADLLDWFAEEGRRAYGRVIPARAPGVSQCVLREPIGPVAAFTPTTFPVSQAIHKIGPALAAGCSVVIRPPDELAGTTAALVEVFQDAGLPPGVLNVVFGDLHEISENLIAHPAIKMVSFIGALEHGKLVAALAGVHMKRSNVEMSGHTAAIVCADADIETAAKLLAYCKYRNCGQVCVSPTHFMIQSSRFDEFRHRLIEAAKGIITGSGDDVGTKMGPLVSAKRLHDIQALIEDAIQRGARLDLGGHRIGSAGHFLEPTILSGITPDMRINDDQLFGPVALLSSFEMLDDVIEQSNRLPFGRAAYAFTSSPITASHLVSGLQVGMLSINHLGLELPELPFGGIKDGGFGSGHVTDSIDTYLVPKMVSHAVL